MSARLTIKEASKRLDMPEQYLRVAIQRDKLPFATCIKNKTQYCYYINEGGLNAYINNKER